MRVCLQAKASWTLAVIVSLVLPSSVGADIVITLKNTFVAKYRDRATVDKDHTKPNPASKDGDLHIAGRASTIGLPTVAELMNAKLDTESVDAIHSVEGTGQKIKLSGDSVGPSVWHAGKQSRRR